jgi:hypothetical protein
MSPYVIVAVLVLTGLFLLLSLAPILISLMDTDAPDPATQAESKAIS